MSCENCYHLENLISEKDIEIRRLEDEIRRLKEAIDNAKYYLNV